MSHILSNDSDTISLFNDSDLEKGSSPRKNRLERIDLSKQTSDDITYTKDTEISYLGFTPALQLTENAIRVLERRYLQKGSSL